MPQKRLQTPRRLRARPQGRATATKRLKVHRDLRAKQATEGSKRGFKGPKTQFRPQAQEANPQIRTGLEPATEVGGPDNKAAAASWDDVVHGGCMHTGVRKHPQPDGMQAGACMPGPRLPSPFPE